MSLLFFNSCLTLYFSCRYGLTSSRSFISSSSSISISKWGSLLFGSWYSALYSTAGIAFSGVIMKFIGFGSIIIDLRISLFLNLLMSFTRQSTFSSFITKIQHAFQNKNVLKTSFSGSRMSINFDVYGERAVVYTTGSIQSLLSFKYFIKSSQ